MVRGRWWIVLAAVAALVAVHGTMWWVVTGRIVAGWPGFVAQAAAVGWRVEADAPHRSGWPLAAAVRLAHVRAVRELGGAALRWTAEDVVLRIAATDPAALQISVEGAQTVAAGTATESSGPVAVRAGLETVRAPFSGGPATFVVESLQAGDEGRGVRVARATGGVAALAFAFDASGVALSPALAAPFDGGMAMAGRVLMSLAVPDAATAGEAAAAWQRLGGRVEAPSMTVDWGPVHVEGHGEGGLDPRLQPTGRAELHVQGAGDALDAAVRRGLVSAAPASAARAVLQLLALAARGGPVSMPLVLADQRLVVAGFPVLKVPALDWNGP